MANPWRIHPQGMHPIPIYPILFTSLLETISKTTLVGFEVRISNTRYKGYRLKTTDIIVEQDNGHEESSARETRQTKYFVAPLLGLKV
jgi:hypothetical protein